MRDAYENLNDWGFSEKFRMPFHVFQDIDHPLIGISRNWWQQLKKLQHQCWRFQISQFNGNAKKWKKWIGELENQRLNMWKMSSFADSISSFDFAPRLDLKWAKKFITYNLCKSPRNSSNKIIFWQSHHLQKRTVEKNSVPKSGHRSIAPAVFRVKPAAAVLEDDQTERLGHSWALSLGRDLDAHPQNAAIHKWTARTHWERNMDPWKTRGKKTRKKTKNASCNHIPSGAPHMSPFLLEGIHFIMQHYATSLKCIQHSNVSENHSHFFSAKP